VHSRDNAPAFAGNDVKEKKRRKRGKGPSTTKKSGENICFEKVYGNKFLVGGKKGTKEEKRPFVRQKISATQGRKRKRG